MPFPDDIILVLERGELAIIPTDTLYGIVCQARSVEAVQKLYRIRGRAETKPCIILIADILGLKEFGINLSVSDEVALKKVWPGKVSVIFECPSEKWAHLHRGGTKTLAFRVPDNEELRNLLRNSGPLPAPSANPEGKPPAHTIAEAKNYFGTQVAVYVDGGYRDSLPSTIARLENGVWETLREGAVVLAPSPTQEKTSAPENLRRSRLTD